VKPAAAVVLTALLTGCVQLGTTAANVAPPLGALGGKPTVNAIFLDHGFDVDALSDAKIRGVVAWLHARDFTYQLHNIATFDARGRIDPANYSQLANWIRVSRAADPNQKIVAYLSGTLDLVNTPSAWSNIAATCKTFARKYGVDGINLDFEPYRTDDVANYRGFFAAVRKAIGPKVQLSLDYTADPGYRWSPSDFKSLSAYFNVIMPMLYDSGCTTAACYKTFVTDAVTYQYANKAPSTSIYPLIPTYAKSAAHLPAVESIESAAAVLNSLIASGKLAVPGAGVWWYYGWNATAQHDWKTYWLT
jgi:hypothetical protein